MAHSSTNAPLEFAFANGLPRSLRGVMSTRAINRFFAAMENESDRGLVIGMISVLDDLMELRLSKIFKWAAFSLDATVERTFVDPLFRDRVAWTDKKTGEPIAMNARRKLMWVVMILILTLHKPASRRTT